MAHERYFVVFHEQQWRIKHNGKYSAGYPTHAEALRAGINAAYKDGECGHQAQVLVHGQDLLFHAEWTYGQDPYPPDERP